MITKQFVRNVIQFDAVSNRLSVLHIKIRVGNMSIVNAYPTEISEDSMKNEFYDHLESIYDQPTEHNVKIATRHINAKVGRDKLFKPTTKLRYKSGS